MPRTVAIGRTAAVKGNVTIGGGWWNTRWFATAAILAAMLPLLWPTVPPLADVPGHIGRYHLMDVLGDGGPLDRYFAVRWAAIGNLGVDLIVLALAPLLGVELAAKLVIMAIPALTVAGFIALSHAVHGRLTAPAIFAFPLAYAYHFQLGFVNYSLSAALAMLALAGWIALAERRALRLALFVPVAGILWLTHSFGWALFGLIAGGAEIALRRRAGDSWAKALVNAGLVCLPLAWPIVLMLGGGRLQGDTGDWFRWMAKAQWIVSLLRERWEVWDVLGAILIYAVTYGMLRSSRTSRSAVLAIPAALCLAAFIVIPRLFQGGAYVDTRILPAAVALALIACSPRDAKMERRIALAGAVFFAARLATSAAACLLVAQAQERELRAIDQLPTGSRMLALVKFDCSTWRQNRMVHLPGLAIARRDAFVNEQWALPGQQLIRPILPGAAPYDRDPSQFVVSPECEWAGSDYDTALAGFDRSVFTHVWTIGVPAARARPRDLTPIWEDGNSTLFRVDRR